MLIRQGDIALVPSAATPLVGEPKHHKLAIGEDSGHAHAIDGLRLGNLLTVLAEAPLTVEPETSAWRHTPIVVPAGTYDVVIQREYTPAGARRVDD